MTVASDLSFNIIALDNASKTFIKLADQVDRLSERLDKLDRKDVTVKVNVKTDESTKALDSFSNRFKLLSGAIVAASPFVGGAILAGVGAGIIGIGVLAQKSNKDVQDSYKQLWQDVVATTKNSSDQIVPQVVAAGRQLDAEVHKLGPQIQAAFAPAGPAIVALTRGITEMADNAMPGVVTAMQNSLPVMEGAASLMAQLGTVGGEALTQLSEHSTQLGVDLASLGGITSSVVGAAVDITTSLGDAWAKNADSIVSAVDGITSSLSGLVNGAMPVLATGLGVVTGAITGLTAVIAPLAPILGTVGAAALALWGAFKLSALATAGVKLLAGGVLSLGANMEVGAAKSGAMIAGLRGVSVQASTTATAVTAAGAATARAATGVAAAAESLAGPLGIALAAGTILFGFFASSEDHAAQSAQNLAAATDTMTSAFEASHGAVNTATVESLKATQAYKETAKAVGAYGVSQEELIKAVQSGGPALDQLKNKLAAVTEQSKDRGAVVRFHQTVDAVNSLNAAWQGGQKSAATFASEQQKVANTLLGTTEFQTTAAATARTLGVSLGDVSDGFRIVVASGSAASTSVQDVAAAFIKSALTVAAAQRSMADHFAAADKSVLQSQQGLVDANHSYAQSTLAVSDAQHSLAGAQRSLKDANSGVASASQALTRAQESERNAQLALNDARKQAIQDLKDLHLQEADQHVSEAQARVRLFDVTKQAALVGVTGANAATIAGWQVNDGNEEGVKAALELLAAQNSLNDTLNSGDKLRKDVAAADAAGVEGSKGVVSAQQAVRSAHDQVISASAALTKSHQQVSDASYAVAKANQAVVEAENQRIHSADRVMQAQTALKDAQDAASRSMDLSTKAGQENLTLLLNMWAAISATGMSTQDKYNALVGDTAKALGISTEAAQGMLTQLGLIPKDFRYSVTAVAAVDLASYGPLLTQLASGDIQSKLGGKIFKGMATGGRVVGKGGPTDDTNLIWASHNEFMQPADAVDHYGVGFMEAVRHKRLKVFGGDGAMLPGYADGGLIADNIGLGVFGASYQSNMNALGVMGFDTLPGLKAYVAPPAAPAVGQPVLGYSPSGGVARWTPQILQALGMLGQPSTWLATVQRRMNQESGGNPLAVNLWDSNAQRGTPSVGLMQVIGPTFAHNAGPFAGTGPFMYGVSVDPLANTFAGLNYAIHRYGSLSALNRPGGYDNGGAVMPGWTPLWNGTGRPENVRSADAEDRLLDAINRLVETGGNLIVQGPVGSQRELENWWVRMHDTALTRGRIS